MSDSSHCQLLFSLLSSRAFLNMHALHFFFPPPYRIQVDVPCSCHCSALPSSAALCYLWLTQFPGWIRLETVEQDNVL